MKNCKEKLLKFVEEKRELAKEILIIDRKYKNTKKKQEKIEN